MEVKCSNVECYENNARFDDCQVELIQPAILLIVISLL